MIVDLSTVIVQGVFSALPAPGIPGRLYFATDTKTCSYDKGTEWVDVTAAGSGGGGGGGTPTNVPFVASGGGNVTVAHGLGAAPVAVMIVMTSGAAVWLQTPTGFDATNLYLTASDAATGIAICFMSPVTVALTPSAGGNFTQAHGLGRIPNAVAIAMTSDGAIWLQTPTSYDATNLYLTASAGGITANAICF